MLTYDAVIKGGRVLDPANKTDAVLDVGIIHGRIDAVGEGLEPSAGGRTIDASGRWVMPGHIDTHAHVSSAGDERNVRCGEQSVDHRHRPRRSGHRAIPDYGDRLLVEAQLARDRRH